MQADPDTFVGLTLVFLPVILYGGLILYSRVVYRLNRKDTQ